MRQDILRGVYEDNLRIIGKGHAAIYKHRYYLPRRLLIPLLLSILIIISQSSLVSAPFLPEKYLRTLASVKTLTAGSAAGDGPSDYKAFIGAPGVPISRVFGLGVKTIMLDPGHGGADNGTKGHLGTKEKDLALDIARRLKDRLMKDGGFNVLMTREGDTTLPLNKRVELAKRSRADLFLSIHLNYLPSRPINMIETYYFGPSSDPNTLKLAEQENADSSYGMSDFRKIIEKIEETLKLQESRQFAASIQKKLFMNIKRENGAVYDFGVKRAPFVVLLGADVPAVLAEVSCLSNNEEEIKLGNAQHRENIARYLELGILDYLNKGDATYEARRQPER
ncbi:MAG: N-acetylmuramoyl-L-alanine amidase [Nitrospiraceae bacterium]|nr:N-acetylmuramoyl-L-alanine amidase [Nitrospiraceae bacterium]